MSDEHFTENGTSLDNPSSAGAIVATPARPAQVPAPVWSYGPPAIPEIINAKPGPVELLHALRRRWMVATGLGLLVGGILAALVWMYVPIRYEVVALLRVLSNEPTVLEESRSVSTEFAIYKRTQAALFKSNLVLQATLRKPEVLRLSVIRENKDNLLDWLASEIIVDFPGDSEVMRISMKGDRPEELKTIVNAVKDSYLDEIVVAERTKRAEQRDSLERYYKKNREDIRNRLVALHKLHKEIGSQTDTTARMMLEMAQRDLNALVNQRNSLQAAVGDIEMRILLLKTRAANFDELNIPDFLMEHQLSNDPTIAQLKQALATLAEMKAEEGRRVRDPNAPSLMRIEQQRQVLEEHLHNRKEELRPVLVEMFKYNSSQGNDPTVFLPLMETEREALLAKLEAVNTQVQEKTDEMLKMDKFSADIETRTAELKEMQDVTQKMGSELKLADLHVQAPQRVQNLEDASVPLGNDAMRKYVAVAFSGTIGFAAVLFGIALLEFQSRRLNSEGEVREGLGIRVIGHLPSLSGRAWRKLSDASSSTGAYLQTLLTESVDSIRATLMHSNGANPPRMVMVCSADTQEGKTTVASQLAASLARAGRRTLLIDGDLRNPASHAVFGLPLGPGFADMLRGDVEKEATIYATPAPNLWLMPAGEFDPSVIQAISGEALVKVMTSLKEQYDYVIVDAPPVLKVADPLIFGQCVDAAILSVRRDVSRIPKVYEASDRLKTVGIRVLGVIVNGVNEKPMKRSAPIQI